MAYTVRVNRSEFCKYEPPLDVIGVTVASSPDPLPADLRVALVRPGFGDVIVRAVAGGGPSANAPLQLNGTIANAEIGERAATHEGINYVRRGVYYVELRDGATGETLGRSGNFPIVVMTLDHFKGTYLFGVPLYAEHMLMPVRQPRQITGAAVRYVDPAMLKGAGQLSYTNAGQLLSWRGGPAEAVDPAGGIQALQLLTPEQDAYLEVEVDPAALPTADTSEALLIDNWRMGDHELRRYLDNAYDQIEQALQCSLEARIVTTDPEIVAFYDEAAAPVERERQAYNAVGLASRHARPLRKVLSLTGHIAGRQVTTIPPEWMVINSKAAVVDLVPTAGAPTLTTIELLGYAGGPAVNRLARVLPGFWHYTVVAGLPSLDGDRFSIREAIAKQAALDALTDLSLAATGGRTSRSAQRDGVSESWSYGGQGAYGEKIGAYRDWLGATLPKMRQFFVGFTVEVF